MRTFRHSVHVGAYAPSPGPKLGLAGQAWLPRGQWALGLGLVLLLVGPLVGCEQSAPAREAEVPPVFSETPLPPLSSPCPDQRGMVGVPFPDGTCYLMDPWPVTRGAYYAAVSQAPLVSSHPECADHPPGDAARHGTWVDSGVPGQVCFITEDSNAETGLSVRVDNRIPWPPSDVDQNEPMVCVTWCDAHAYCERVGKRLCQNTKLNQTSEYDEDALHEPENDEFFNACTGGGSRPTPTGQAWPPVVSERRLIGDEWKYFEQKAVSRATLLAVGEGAFRGIWGLSIGAEVTGPVHFTYRLRGQVEGETDQSLPTCGAYTTDRRDTAVTFYRNRRFSGASVFRCCADVE